MIISKYSNLIRLSKLVKSSYRLFSSTRLLTTPSRLMFSSNLNKQEYENLKSQGQKFYTQQVSTIIELEKSQNWQNIVVNSQHPIIVDFYADWCQPCKKLTPKLKQRVLKAKNLTLLMINIDKCSQLAHALQIKSVPTVYLIYKNQAIDRLQGLPSQQILDKFFQNAQKVQSTMNNYQQYIIKLQQAKSLMSNQKFEEAQKILINMPTNIQQQLFCLRQLFLGHCYLLMGNMSKFVSQYQNIKKFETYYKQNPQLKQFYQVLHLKCQQLKQVANSDQQIINAIKNVNESPQNMNYIFQLAQVYKKKSMNEQALIAGIQLVKKNKNWQNGKMNKFILEIFKELGNSSPLTKKYRKIYQQILY